jgi:hypothetical protein
VAFVASCPGSDQTDEGMKAVQTHFMEDLIMPGSGVLIVRNMHGGPTTFTYEHDGMKTPYEWFGAGDVDERDILEVPESIAVNPHFRKAVARGILRVEEGDEDVVESISRAGQRWQDRQNARRNEIEAQFDRQEDRSMVVVACVGPGPRGSTCGASVFERAKTQSGKPPLCPNHEHLSTNFVQVETNEIIDGHAVMTWVQASKTATNAIDA